MPELHRAISEAPDYPVIISDYLQQLQADTLAKVSVS